MLLRVEGLCARPAPEEGTEPGPNILNGFDLRVGRGEVHAIMGPNGSGKSTLANTLLGNPSYEVTGGRIVFQGDDITDRLRQQLQVA